MKVESFLLLDYHLNFMVRDSEDREKIMSKFFPCKFFMDIS